MKKTKLIVAFVIAVMMVTVLVACGTTPPTETSTSPAETSTSPVETPPEETSTAPAEIDPASLTIGCSYYGLEHEFFQKMQDGTEAKLTELGYKFKPHDQQSDEAKMVEGCNSLLDENVAALIISPVKPDALKPIVDKAKGLNIPVVIDDIGGGDTDYNAIVVSDCAGGGKKAAEYVITNNKAESKDVAVIKCETSAVYANRRGAGFKEAIEAAGYKVVAEPVANSLQEEGYERAKELLSAHKNLVAIFCENDNMALGAAQAVKDAKKEGIMIIGFNNDPAAQEAIKAGTMAATVAQYPDQMGALCATIVDDILRGKTLNYSDPATREFFADVDLMTKETLK